MITPRKTRNVARAIVREWRMQFDLPVEQYLLCQKISRLGRHNLSKWDWSKADWYISDRAHGFPQELRKRQLEEEIRSKGL